MMVSAHLDPHPEPAAGPLLVPVVAALVILALCYVRGTLTLCRHGRRREQRLRLLACGAGIAAVTVTILPLGRLMESRLATHMLEHMVLIVIAAPLLAMGACGQAVWVGLPRRVRAPLARWLHRPAPGALRDALLLPPVAWATHVAVLWTWHLPAAYDAALRSPVLHALEHALFLGTAWLFWWHIAAPSRRRLSPPLATLYLTAAALPGAALGAVLTFAPAPLYPVQAQAAADAGADVMTDQRLAGLIMWVPVDVAYLAVAMTLFLSWFARGGDPAVLPSDARAPAGVGATAVEGVRR
jgi:putative membrane protein